MTDKLPFDDERYRINGTNAFSLSKWSRENDPKDPPRFKVGDHVVLVVCAEVMRVYQDCDGTPLYELSPGGNGWSEASLLSGDANDWLIEDRAELARRAAERDGAGGAPDAD